MRRLHPEIIHHKGKPQFAVIPYAEFLALQEELDDAACLRALRKAKATEKNASTKTLSEIKAKLGLPTAKKRRATAVAWAPEGQFFYTDWPELTGPAAEETEPNKRVLELLNFVPKARSEGEEGSSVD